MGLSQRKKTNRKFNGTKMVINNVGTPSTLIPKNQFTETNQFPELNPGTNNFVPCTFEQGLYNPEFVYQQIGQVNVCLDQNPFYGKNRLMLGKTNGLSVVNSKTGELIHNDDNVTSTLSILQLPLNEYLIIRGNSNLIRKVNSDLSTNNSFISYFEQNKPITHSVTKITPDNKLIVYLKNGSSPYKVGYFGVDDTYYQQVYKLNFDGTIDNNFYNRTTYGLDTNTQFFPYSPSFIGDFEIVPTTNSQYYSIYFAGKFISYQGYDYINFCKIDQSGIIDEEFVNPFTDFNQPIYSLKYVGEGKMLVGGDFVNIENYNYLLRFDTNGNGGHGSVDTTFINPNLPGPVSSIDLDVDGKILISYRNLDASGLKNVYIRLNPDGSVDNTFNLENFISGTNRLSGGLIYKSSNGGYFLKGFMNKFENGDSAPSFIKLKGC